MTAKPDSNPTITADDIDAQPLDASTTLVMAERFKALSHPVRLRILYHLSQCESCCCNDLCDCLPLAQSTISQHLKVLHNAGLIDWRAKGNCSHYKLVPGALERVGSAVNNLVELGSKKTCNSSQMKEI